MFALVILLLVLIQVNAVPAANKQVEFEHNQRVTQDFQSLQEGIYRVGSTGSPESITVENGVTYPSRFFLLNPAPSTGSVRTTSSQTVTIRNAEASGNPGDYWTGDPVTYTTSGLQYSPDYNELPNPGELNWEHSLGYRTFDDGTIAVDDPTSVIDGRSIQFRLIDGQFDRAGLSTPIEIAPISTQSREVSVTDTGTPIELRLQTDLPPEEWNETLAAQQYATFGGYDPTTETLTVELAQGVTYDLTVSKVRIGSATVPGPGAHYLTDVSGNESSVAENTTRRFTVEARDRYNNPVSDVPVNATIVNDGAFADDAVELVSNNRTDSDGRITFRYVAPPPTTVGGDTPIQIRMAMPDGTDADSTVGTIETTRFDLTVLDSDRSGSSPGDPNSDGVSRINPGGDSVRLTDANSGGGQKSDQFTLTFKNDAGTTKTMDQMRLLFFQTDDGTEGSLVSVISPVSSGAIERYQDFRDVPDIQIGTVGPVQITFEADKSATKGDFIGISVLFTDGTRNNYFAEIP